MKTMMLGMVGALALAGGVARASDPPAATTTETRNESLNRSLEKQVQPALQALENAWNRQDPKAFADAFQKDAVLINPSGRVARGQAQLEKLFQDEHAGMMKDTRFSQKVIDVRELSPTLAFVDTAITISGVKDPSGKAGEDMKIHGAMLLSKQAGTWRILEGRPYAFTPPQQLGVGGSGLQPTPQPMQPAPEPKPEGNK